ncbi:MAG: glycogen debranching enzyme N-terminal domain-containing protein [Betaproteobacteria bacterium]|nr:glycogen debranching enzyme N-terminal domain-containing protein [Betaproteobacteria bacterium]
MEQELPQLIHFGREICNDLEQAERREWWLANGLGGFAAGTVAGTLTRRYHGLLLAPLKPPLGRNLLFVKADATLIMGETRYPLYTNRWRSGALDPRGHLHLESFRLDGRTPVFRYAISDVRLEARIWMEHGANTTYVAWQLLSPHPEAEGPRLAMRLLVDARDYHAQTRAGGFDAVIEQQGSELRIHLPGDVVLRFRTRCGRFTVDKTWVERFDLTAERGRGLPDEDNHLCVGEVNLPLYSGEYVGFLASLEDDPSPYLTEALRRRHLHDVGLLRQAKLLSASLENAPPWIEQLVLAADSFLIQRPISGGKSGSSVIAGYPWFGDWGRDTFIALPGLVLVSHRHHEAREILQSWAEFIDHGLLPNYFPESGRPPEYNAADAALWYLEAWRAYIEANHDLPTLAAHYPKLVGIIRAYEEGTRLGLAMDPGDGLLRAGGNDTQATWMDARVAGRAVTPRAGKPVEINALWFNALKSLAEFAGLLGEDPTPFAAMAVHARKGFQRFIRPDGMGLYDVLDGPQGHDDSLRPNQILAVSLVHSPLDPHDQFRVVDIVGTRLLVSYGLRTLDPAHPRYHARYDGDPAARDAAYHQGPAWAWLLGHYALATFRATDDPDYAQSLLAPIGDHLADAGLGTVSELFDGDPPHTPRGAPAQAWSVACTLMAWSVLERAKRRRKGHASREAHPRLPHC